MTILMRSPNFLILDEPTNDLDIVTLNVLEDYLSKFDGCVLIVSHDRFFMDKVVDHIFVFEGNGKVKDFPGNYTQYRNWKEGQEQNQVKVIKENNPEKEKDKPVGKRKLTYKESKELELLDNEIAELENEKNTIEKQLSSGAISAGEITKISLRLNEVNQLIEMKTERWMELSEFA
jgi:ATP-binding cassette subfamily F protein uup